MFFGMMVMTTVFDKYIIAIDTFLSWVPADRQISYLRLTQLTKSLLMQSGPFLGGFLVSISGPNRVSVYHKVLAAIMLALTLLFNLVFKDEQSGLRQLPKQKNDDYTQGGKQQDHQIEISEIDTANKS